MQEKSIELESTQIIIRATDKDSGKRGSGATIPEFSDKRMRLSIDTGIDLSLLSHHDVVSGNVTIFYALDNKGNVSKMHAHLFSVVIETTNDLNNE